ncbi:MAG: DUF4197 domain-containing protein [Bacteroidia bacterium]
MLARFKFHALAIVSSLVILSSCDILEEILGQVQLPVLSQEEIAKGLKEALRVGTDTAVTRLSRNNGFYKDKKVQIGLPHEADIIVKNISKVPLLGDKLIDETKKLINRAAEDAATEAAPIFKNAITSMSISDAVGILRGNDSAATHYLRKSTYKQLYNKFMPKIEASLGRKIVKDVSADGAYKALIDKYNMAAKIPFSGLEQVKSNSLSQYVTQRALNGLFLKVADEENSIRHDVNARVNDILKKVFDENNVNSAVTF